MKLTGLLIGLAAGTAAACATPAPPGPTRMEFSALIPDHLVREADCAFVAEEGSEWTCRYQRWTAEGRWETRDAVVARDGDRWVLVDG
ncbi:hypothetical protein [Brevundimonas sp.]|uniref:hypothetical protein n=1 Tax=Brevundimonas sp. TaxID=1871086 RepID=UPI002737CF7D|nr:hypothetical protein [Brevundimonas sp.]MDP3802885.1 hypothetical protein [Brevundimonas sp.]